MHIYYYYFSNIKKRLSFAVVYLEDTEKEVSCLQSINGFPLGPKIEKIKLAAEGLNFNVLIALSPLNLTNGLSSILLLFKVALKSAFLLQDY